MGRILSVCSTFLALIMLLTSFIFGLWFCSTLRRGVTIYIPNTECYYKNKLELIFNMLFLNDCFLFRNLKRRNLRKVCLVSSWFGLITFLGSTGSFWVSKGWTASSFGILRLNCRTTSLFLISHKGQTTKPLSKHFHLTSSTTAASIERADLTGSLQTCFRKHTIVLQLLKQSGCFLKTHGLVTPFCNTVQEPLHQLGRVILSYGR